MPSMERDQLVQHLTPPPGVVMPPYPAARDRWYRWSLLAAALGFFGQGIATLAANRDAIAFFHGWLAIALASAGWTFLVWLRNWRYLVRGLVTVGLLLWPWWTLGSWALTLSASAVMTAKETHCFHFPAGRIIPWYSLALGAALILGRPEWLIGCGWLGLATLWGWLVWGRLHLPLFEI